jgi:hypothetical protein
MIKLEAKSHDVVPSIVYLNPEHIAEIDIVLERHGGVLIEKIFRIMMVSGEWFNYRTSEYLVGSLEDWLDWKVRTNLASISDL